MKTEYIAFNHALSKSGIDPVDQGDAAGIAIAQAIADVLPLPSAPVEDLEEFYRNSQFETARQYINAFNENVTVSADEVVQNVRAFWCLRYNMTFPSINPIRLAGDYGYFDTIMGVGLYVADKTHKLANEYKSDVLQLYAAARYIIEQRDPSTDHRLNS